MISEYAKAFAYILAFVLSAILISKALQTPLQPMALKPRVVKTILIDPDTEIERQRGWE